MALMNDTTVRCLDVLAPVEAGPRSGSQQLFRTCLAAAITSFVFSMPTAPRHAPRTPQHHVLPLMMYAEPWPAHLCLLCLYFEPLTRLFWTLAVALYLPCGAGQADCLQRASGLRDYKGHGMPACSSSRLQASSTAILIQTYTKFRKATLAHTELEASYAITVGHVSLGGLKKCCVMLRIASSCG